MVLSKLTFSILSFMVCASVSAAEVDHSMHGMNHDMHAMHHDMNHEVANVVVSTQNYATPDVSMVREDGQRVSLKDALSDARPVLMSFIYTDCTAICPLISQTMAQFQGMLGANQDAVQIISISIDPEQDTPAKLADYASHYGAGSSWHHYTGTLKESVTAQMAFNVYRGDKMNHTPVYLLRSKPGAPWIRLDGFAKAEQLFEQYQKMINF